jgi:enoyl-CoA hydratase/carnithine racemase
MSVRLPERVGRSTAKELMFTSRRISGPEALAIGLVDRCVADEELDSVVASLAEEIAANSPGTNRIVKRLVDERWGSTRSVALQRERTMPHGLPDDMASRMGARPSGR